MAAIDQIVICNIDMSNEKLVKAYHDGNKEAMSVIIEKNRGLVYFFVNRYYNIAEISYLDKEDLLQIGYIGLMNAVRGFDLAFDVKFSSYAGIVINRELDRNLAITTPREKRSVKDSKLCNFVSIYENLPGNDDITYQDAIEDESAAAEFSMAIEELDRQILRKDLFEIFGKVFNTQDKEKNSIILKYGLNGQEYTCKEIGEFYQVSTSRAQQLIAAGMRKIRKSKSGRQLREKYKAQFDLDDHLERLTQFEYKDPSSYLLEQERFNQFSRA